MMKSRGDWQASVQEPLARDDLGAVHGKPISVGKGFNALSFKHAMFAGAMDPLVMIDHYVMAEPTFGAHGHAGISADDYPRRQFSAELAPRHAAMLVCITGEIEVDLGSRHQKVAAGQVLPIEPRQKPRDLRLHAAVVSQAVLLTGEPIGEDFVQRGPFVMTTEAEPDRVEADYRAGRLCSLTDDHR